MSSEKRNCRNCTSCFFETRQMNGIITNRIRCAHEIVDLVIGENTNYFIKCEKYNELHCAKILGIPITNEIADQSIDDEKSKSKGT